MLSKEYRDQLAQLHDSSAGWGTSAGRWTQETRMFAERLKTKDILDYGAGKGALKEQLKEYEFRVREYDPGIPGKDSPPKPADLVACLDVLEHIEPDHLDSVLAHIYTLARKGSLCVIALYQGGRRLPDGRPAHLIVESVQWWEDRIRAQWPGARIEFDHRPVPGRAPHKRVRDCLVVKMEKGP